MSDAVLQAGIHRQRFRLGEDRHTKLGQPSRESRERFPFYWMLVDSGIDTPVEMLGWKIYVRERCIEDLEFRQAIIEMCRVDVAFYAATLVWIFEPRPTPRHLPYCPWVDQVDVMAWADECFPTRPLGNEKTRGIGVTWLYSTFFSNKWYFMPDCRIAVLTKDKDLLESQDDNSLIGKFVFIHEHMPFWVRYDQQGRDIMHRSIENHQLTNLTNKAFIRGYLSTNSKVRSLRFTVIWADEIAFFGRDAQEWMVSTGGTTHCRFMTSTWNCLGSETNVLTNNGVKNILEVKDTDLLWDGAEWVSHGGRVFTGIRPTIRAYGTWMTPDHKILTEEGWKHARHRLPASIVATPKTRPQRRPVQAPYTDLPSVERHDTTVYEQALPTLRLLSGARDKSVPSLEILQQFLARHGRMPSRTHARSNRQPRELHPGKLSLGDSERTAEQSSLQHHGDNLKGCSKRVGAIQAVGGVADNDSISFTPRLHGGPASPSESSRCSQPVYDLINAGPRHRFTIVAADGTLTIVHNSFGDMFHHIMHEDESSMLRVFSYWQNNLERWKGAYYIQNGRVVFVDKHYQHPPDYAFGEPDLIPEGTLRSPWVDGELLEPGVDPYKTLRDIYGPEVCERDAAFFKPEFRRALESSKEDPDTQGNINTMKPVLELIPTRKSDVKMWGSPSEWQEPLQAGFDLAFGKGANYSVMEIIDGRGHQVLEYCTNRVALKDFAQDAVKIAKWIASETDLITQFDFESNGPGAEDFWSELERLKYRSVHKTVRAAGTKKKKRYGVFDPHYYGTHNSDANHANFTELERAVLSMSLVVKSEGVWAESKLFGIDEKGKPEFPRMNKIGHGDRMAALGIAWNRIKDRVTASRREAAQNPRAFEIPTHHGEPVLSFDGYANKLWSTR